MTHGPAPRVFVVQQPVRLVNGEWVPSVDITPAREFGKFVFVLAKPGNIYLKAFPQVLAHMRNVLNDFGEEDFILPTGEPVAIATACIIASGANQGRLKILKWNRHRWFYEIVQISTGS